MTEDHKRSRSDYFEDRAGTDDARYHVVPHHDDWAVKREGEDDPVHTAESKEKAIDKAKDLAEEYGTIAYIHGDDGKIEDQIEYE